jgi:hypothetical protein
MSVVFYPLILRATLATMLIADRQHARVHRTSASQGPVDSTDRIAAAVTLLVYKATTLRDRRGPIISYSIAPDPIRLTFDEAANKLSLLPKPLDCATRRSSSSLVLICEPIRDTELLRLRAQLVAINVAGAAHLMKSSDTASRLGNLIELRAGDERLVLSLTDYERWTTDYRLTTEHAISMDHPPHAYADRRIGLLMEVGGGDAIKEHFATPD